MGKRLLCFGLGLAVTALPLEVRAGETVSSELVRARFAEADGIWRDGTVYVDRFDDGCGLEWLPDIRDFDIRRHFAASDTVKRVKNKSICSAER